MTLPIPIPLSHLDKVIKLQKLSRVVNKLAKPNAEYRLLLDHVISPDPSCNSKEEEVIVLESKLRKDLKEHKEGEGEAEQSQPLYPTCLVKKQVVLGVNNTRDLFSSYGDPDPNMFNQQELELVSDVIGYIKKSEEPRPVTPEDKKELQFMIEPEYTEKEQEYINERLA